MGLCGPILQALRTELPARASETKQPLRFWGERRAPAMLEPKGIAKQRSLAPESLQHLASGHLTESALVQLLPHLCCDWERNQPFLPAPGAGQPLGPTASATSSQPTVVPMEFPQTEVKDVQRGQASQLQLHHPGKVLLPFPFALWLCSEPRSQHVRWDWPGAARFHKG